MSGILPIDAAVEKPLEEHCRRCRVVAVRPSRGEIAAIRVVNRSSSITIGISHRCLSRPTKDAVSAAWAPFCPASVKGRPTTISSGRSRSMIAESSASPARAPARRTVVSGRASVPDASEIATPVRELP